VYSISDSSTIITTDTLDEMSAGSYVANITIPEAKVENCSQAKPRNAYARISCVFNSH
jgi:hypothetical protein